MLSDNDEQTQAITKAVDNAFRLIMNEHDPGNVVVKWVVAIRVEGGSVENSGTWILSPDNMDEIDDLGMLQYAINDTNARQIKNILREDDD
jgi:hypothetical protein